MRQDMDFPMSPFDRPDYERDVGALGATLDDATRVATWAEGRSMTLDEVLASVWDADHGGERAGSTATCGERSGRQEG